MTTQPPAPDDVDWDERYSADDRIWSGEPNGALVASVPGIAPGRVLDVGCGEGADAVWLAQRGWDVTALEVSAVALARARQHADASGVDIRWYHGPLLDAPFPAGSFDLVSAQYPALAATADHRAERALAALVAPGGTLLVVHHVVDPDHAREHGFDPAAYVGPADVRAVLDERWDVAFDASRPRTVNGGSGAHHTHDVVLHARRSADH